MVPPTSERIAPIDYVKAAAIIAVVFTHAGAAPWDPHFSEYDRLLSGLWVDFQVPAFLLLSGFLYFRRSPIDLRGVGARLSRVLVPYLIASTIAQIVGLSGARGAWDVLFQFVTASSLGIYYYIFLLVSFTPTIWVLSRLPQRWLWLTLIVVWVLTLSAEIYARLFLIDSNTPRNLGSLFWLMRSPYWYAMFLTGWTAALHLPVLQRFMGERRHLAALLCLAGVASYAALVITQLWNTGGIGRMIYTLCVVGALALATRSLHIPAAIRFLSEASLALYLYHHLFQLALYRHVIEWPPVNRIFLMAFAGLAGATAICLLGRRLLGRRARSLLGT